MIFNKYNQTFNLDVYSASQFTSLTVNITDGFQILTYPDPPSPSPPIFSYSFDSVRYYDISLSGGVKGLSLYNDTYFAMYNDTSHILFGDKLTAGNNILSTNKQIDSHVISNPSLYTNKPFLLNGKSVSIVSESGSFFLDSVNSFPHEEFIYPIFEDGTSNIKYRIISI